MYDLVIIGGGINGAGIARDAAGRGLKVLLAEKDDLASHTSNWSSKLIHGGLRYLEHFEFRLVREALIERENLLRAAPHIIWPLTFVLPHSPEQRPAWLIRLGLFLYDHLGGRELLPSSRQVDLKAPGPLGDPLKPWVQRGFTYADGWVMDSRLVVLNAIAARELGADIRTRTRVAEGRRVETGWQIRLKDTVSGEEETVQARAIVNAAGPWVAEMITQGLSLKSTKRVRLVKGSHLVVPRMHDGEHAYILQNDDKRIVFVIPFEGSYSLIGTTDLEYQGDPARAEITPEETEYLCRVVNRYFASEIGAGDVVWSYSGVRPLFDDAAGSASAVTRDYVFDIDTVDGGAPLLSVFGGKITTYRKLAEHAVDNLKQHLNFDKPAWTRRVPLPGGDIADADFERFFGEVQTAYPWLEPALARRLARLYGTRIHVLLDGAQGTNDLGAMIAPGLYQRELSYLVAHEWVRTGDDVLWRRTKLGLRLPTETHGNIDAWLNFEKAGAE